VHTQTNTDTADYATHACLAATEPESLIETVSVLPSVLLSQPLVFSNQLPSFFPSDTQRLRSI